VLTVTPTGYAFRTQHCYTTSFRLATTLPITFLSAGIFKAF